MKVSKQEIFKQGSTTFFNSSLFFSKKVRSRILKLYAFVRTADDFVDKVPQDKSGFENFCREYYLAIIKGESDHEVVDDFVKLSRECKFETEWADKFLQTMRSDLVGKKYVTIGDTLEYMYGSANVVGLWLVRILDLPKESECHAEMLGRAMQYINFIRDIAEDVTLNRCYFPEEELSTYGLKNLSEEVTRRKPKQFEAFLRKEIERYREWQATAEEGFKFIPKRELVAIKTASDMYEWTAEQIEKNPWLVYQRKVKPSKVRIVMTGLINFVRIYSAF